MDDFQSERSPKIAALRSVYWRGIVGEDQPNTRDETISRKSSCNTDRQFYKGVVKTFCHGKISVMRRWKVWNFRYKTLYPVPDGSTSRVFN